MAQTLNKEQIAYDKLKEFLESELDDYSFNWTIKRDIDYDADERIAFEVDYTNPFDNTYELQFYYDIKEDDLYICKYEDIYELTRWWDSSVRYFWMLVKWD